MKVKTKLMSLVCFSLLSSATAYASERSVEFSIPGNQYCDANHVSEVSFSISNLSDINTTIRLDLYKVDGAELQSSGTANNGMTSDLMLGQDYVLAGRETATFHAPFGKGNLACSDRVYYGKISISDLNGRVIASGFISGRNKELFRSGVPILINNGIAF
ncbi:hypothetical protein [Marinomonas mediterranea]|jgi:hypothetical protein|uniref:Uncharacterized protein n=1 Tax=Marinomonas mediterranea (strain ATCC 700492 / JCM 21426 / NBRC 103028 / MMB-1) TaxID=717774 RepID=F2JYF5_MARM1|nr:hypothetical protein [Marinomonas mediterranea]ADZ93084.1 hypothetical protein Marme_3874 [Marinomonas mediterranea MMB-1]WCN10990.1 hypothetical protein GV055_19660 [Marinomonas mediterranea]WCN15052.1 hypothetical protein GV054_19565 [Marinomonas mediterranea]WCN19096.1 hypothetical protein GV053_19625 [Marinomonas mediterranea MMB-1]